MPRNERAGQPVTHEREALESVATPGFFGRFANIWRWPRRWRTRILSWLAVAGLLAYAFLLVWPAVPQKPGGVQPWIDRYEAIIYVLLPLAVGLAGLLLLRLRLAKRAFTKRAVKNTREFVPTAKGSIIQDVVGRDQMCYVLKENLRDPNERRPHLLVGGPGAGKTAVIVRLTKLLAKNRAVPVPLRLRDLGDGTELDFSELARKRFCREVDEAMLESWLVKTRIAEEAWRWLRKENRIVVLADGLEEVFADGKKEKDRDNLIRNAIRDAGKDRLPLIIATRPHAPLESVEAAVVELEPLSEEAALAYVQQHYDPEEEHRLDWVVERGRVTDMPLYLRITKELSRKRMLQHVLGRTAKGKLDTRSVDRPALRRRLMKTWVDAVIEGEIQEKPALTRFEREAAILQVSALACIGLRLDTVEVPFGELDTALPDNRETEGVDMAVAQFATTDTPGGEAGRGWDALLSFHHRPPRTDHGQTHWSIAQRLSRKLDELSGRAGPDHFGIDLPLAAIWAEQLGLVEAHGERVRFQHSLMQAYLGARFMEDLPKEDVGQIVSPAIRNSTGPGPELLTALVFLSRNDLDATIQRDGQHARTDDDAQSEAKLVKELQRAAQDLMGNGNRSDRRKGEKVLDLYGTALEIDAAHVVRRHRQANSHPATRTLAGSGCGGLCLHHELAAELAKKWREIRSDDTKGLEEAKLQLVHRFGEVLRSLGEQWEADRSHPDNAVSVNLHLPAYERLREIGLQEESYRVRIAIVEELGAGGDTAHVALYDELKDPWTRYKIRQQDTEDIEIREADRVVAQERVATKGTAAGARREGVRKVPVTKGPPRQPPGNAWDLWREVVLAAQVTPLLLGSVAQSEHRENVKRWLHSWCEGINPDRREDGHRDRLPLSVERALARGFKAAANRRVRHPASSTEARDILIGQAEQMLRCARSWFTQLTLIHALTLWALPDEEVATGDNTAQWQDKSPRNRVDQWLDLASIGSAGRLHPFVLEAANLAESALRTRKPEQFIWIDEVGVVNRIGSATGDPTRHRIHSLWIPPSTGWSALRPEAQQLVGDVLLLLNLSERGETPRERDRYLERVNQPELPPCLDGDRRPLDPLLSVAKQGPSRPGSRCVDGCSFELCPYPPRGARDLRELGEAFCRRQATAVSSGFRERGWRHPFRRHRAPWQHTKRRDLRQFWNDMAARMHTHTGPDDAAEG
ncbi:hypothetical protein FHU38_000246 [Saccharomonospora amisosensis]|uniref:NACHT domain-containing protein n=1 Tax=Saccharomonospora amisosensis TaxID=1128677 RepID=A0A7X5UKX0_9PSEU|nr:NACHT domain-containing protein [Saccharomonospora amisosensis]NIJ09902.1 hypothetical protein [Saccharomonospora amisosensis]